MRVIICGSRHWQDRQPIIDRIATLPADSIVVAGGARGVDSIAAEEAMNRGLKVEIYPAKWERFGKGAGPIRNRQMASLGADLCIAFLEETPESPSRGTRDMIKQAQEHNIPVEIIQPE